jgi:hypothetical protein
MRKLSLFVIWMVMAGCRSSQPQETSSVQVLGTLQQAAVADLVSRVSLAISAPDMPERTFALDRSGSSWGSIIHLLPAGSNRTFAASAYAADDTLLFQGSASGVTLTAGQTTLVSITLQQVNPPEDFENSAPVITSLVAAPSTVSPGGTVSLSAVAEDADGDALSFAWSASAGTFSPASSASTLWTAPSQAGSYPLTLTITDARGATATAQVTLTVRAATGSAAVNVSFNTWPQVARVAASANPVQVGQATTLSVTASDADGDSLSYSWSATCAGSFSDASAATSQFTPSSLPASPICPNCTLSVQVADGRGGSTTGSYALCVGAQAAPRLAPVLTEASQSHAAVAPGGTVTLRVAAQDPQNSALTFSWQTSAGSLGAASNTANSSRVVWTAPGCEGAGSAPTVTATVTNALGLSDSFTFSVAVSATCATPIVYPDTSLTACPAGQELLYFYYAAAGDLPEFRASSWCGAAEADMAWANIHDPNTWRRPYLIEQCTPGVSWSYSHAFPDGTRYYSPLYRGINMVCRASAPQRIVYTNTSLTACPAGQALVYFYNSGLEVGDLPDTRDSTWCGAVQRGMDWANIHDPITSRRPYLVEQCSAGVSWSYSHAFPDGTRYYSPSYSEGISLVCQVPAP